jgi:hypothetical protein
LAAFLVAFLVGIKNRATYEGLRQSLEHGFAFVYCDAGFVIIDLDGAAVADSSLDQLASLLAT